MKFYTILTILYIFNIGSSFRLNHPKLSKKLKLRVISPDQLTSNIDSVQQVTQETVNKMVQYPSLLQVAVNELSFLFNNILFPLFVVSTLFSILSSILNPQSGMGMNQLRLNNVNTNMNSFDAVKQNISLSSWVGSPEVFEECIEVISYLKNESSYKLIGAELPRGILLEGPPGTGKTLLAKAIASETESNFIAVSGSEFVELFVGMGALRVRQLFKQARAKKPCVIFIDEIDTIGKKRSVNIGTNNDEREQTLNQLLAEMDGFADNEGIFILAATNRKDVLDEALIRPGRFDRVIKIGLPDKTSREQILKFYLDKKPTDKTIDVKSVSSFTDGMSGAELKNLVNEAAILAVRQGKDVISRVNLDNALEKLAVGLIKNTDTRSLETLFRVAIHEIGHTYLVLLYNKYFDFYKVSIKATYNGAGGYTLFSEKSELKDGGLYTKDLLFKRLVIAMGGKAAESVFFGDEFVSGGASQDLKQANNLARQMIGTFGMGDELMVFHNKNLDNQYDSDTYSDITKSAMDEESLDLVYMAYNEAKRIISENKTQFQFIVNRLLDNKVLSSNDIQEYQNNKQILI